MPMRYDLAIVGSGGAAFAAAIAASGHGARAVMVERGTVGGTCVNTGCVPSKTLLAAAEARHVAAGQPFPGIGTSAGPVDAGALFVGKDALVAGLRADKYVELAAAYGWEIVPGSAVFAGTVQDPVLDVALADGATRRIEAEHYLIATGSAPWAPPIPGLAQAGYLSSTTALELGRVPESLLVLGGNAIGLELAQLFSRLGSQVTVVEALERIAPFEEPEISAGLAAVFGDEGIAVHTAANTTAVARNQSGHTLTLAGAGDLHGEDLLVATGRRPVTNGLNLDAVRVKTGERGEVVVDDQQRTSNPRVWAAGDVTGAPQFVYVAAAQGSVVADNALAGAARALDYTALPRVTFTSPQIASVGLTDHQAVAAGYRCSCRVLPLQYVPRAIVNRDTRGLVKLVADRDTDRLLGAHILAESAGDLITTAVHALDNRATITQLAQAWTPYLTMAEALKLAAQTFTRDVSQLSCCAA
jgi:mercuric reductase